MKYIISLVFSLLSVAGYSQLDLSPITKPLTVPANITYLNGPGYYAPTYGMLATEYGLQMSDDRINNYGGIYISDIDLAAVQKSGGFRVEFTYDLAGKGYNGTYGNGFVMSFFVDGSDSQIPLTNQMGATDIGLGYSPYLNSYPTTVNGLKDGYLGLQKGYIGFGFDLSSKFKNGYYTANAYPRMQTGIATASQASDFLTSPSTITVRSGVGQQSVNITGFAVLSSVATNFAGSATTPNKYTLYDVNRVGSLANDTYKAEYVSISKPFSIKGGEINPIPRSQNYRRAIISYLPGTTLNTYYFSVKVQNGDTWEQVMPWTYVPSTVYYTSVLSSASGIRMLNTVPYSSGSNTSSTPMRIAFTATSGPSSGAQMYVRNLGVTALYAPIVQDYIIGGVSLPKAGATYTISIDGSAAGYAGATATIGSSVGTTPGAVNEPELSAGNVDYSTVRLMSLNETTGSYEPVSNNSYTTPAGTFTYNSTTKQITFTAGSGIGDVSKVSIGYDVLGTNGIRSRTGVVTLNVVDNGYVPEDEVVDYVKING